MDPDPLKASKWAPSTNRSIRYQPDPFATQKAADNGSSLKDHLSQLGVTNFNMDAVPTRGSSRSQAELQVRPTLLNFFIAIGANLDVSQHLSSPSRSQASAPPATTRPHPATNLLAAQYQHDATQSTSEYLYIDHCVSKMLTSTQRDGATVRGPVPSPQRT